MEMEQKLNLITRNLQEYHGLEQMRKIMEQRPLKIYWGTAPTGRIHIGYLVPLLKIADYLAAGCEVKILFADLHAMLDNLKSTPELVQLRCDYYEKMIKTILRELGVELDNLIFVRGSSFQLTPEYTNDVYKISTLSSLRDCKKAGAEVVKQTENPKLSGLLYPILQALDEEYLDVDAQFGGIDQRKILMFAADALPTVGYAKRCHLMTPMLTAIDSQPSSDAENIYNTKMSSSNLNSKIDFLDGKGEIKRKINRAYCLEGDMTFNPLMDLMKLVIFPLLENQCINGFVINRSEKYGGPILYDNYDALSKDFSSKNLHPQDLKLGIIDCLNNFIEKIRIKFTDKESINLLKSAYPIN